MDNILLFRENEFNANFYYYSHTDIDNSFYLKLGKKEMLFVPKLNERAAKLAFKGNVYTYKKPVEDIAQFIKGKKLCLDYSSLSAKIYENLKKVCKPTDASADFLNIRAKKKPLEIEKIKKAVYFSKKIISEISISDFKTEQELRNALEISALENGLRIAFEPIVGSGVHSVFPHYKPTSSKIKNFALIDFGVRYKHYCSDNSRIIFAKKEKKVLDAYEKVQAIFCNILDCFSDFETGREIALFSEKLFQKYKLPKPIHSIGHGVGLDIHEYPRLNKKYSDALAGAVIAIEPAIYFRDFGVRFEEMVYFDGKKVCVL